MPGNAKKLLITTVSHEIVVVRVNHQTPAYSYCPKCDTEVEMLALDAAVSLSGIGWREVIRQIVSDELHSIETANGDLRVCHNSLINGLQKK
jgi:hypothetical protein